VQDYASVGFVDYVADGYPLTHDLHLSATSPAIRAGSSTYAPATDYAGNARPDRVFDDVGAYVYDDPDVTAPSQITLSLDYRNASSTQVSWSATAAADAWYYTIYRGTVSGSLDSLDTVAIGTEVYYDDTIDVNTAYYFAATCRDSSGNESVQRELLVPDDTTAPSAIADLAVTAYYDSVSLSWSAVAAADLDYYNLYRVRGPQGGLAPSVGAGDLFDTIAGGTEVYHDTNVSTAGDSTYYYRVAAVDSSANVATLSNTANATPEGTPLAFSAFAAATPTIADTTASRTAEMTLSSATINRAAAFAIKFWDAESAEPDTGVAGFNLMAQWQTPAATDWSGAYDTGISVPVATSDTSVTLSWDDVTGETSYLLERNVSGAGWTTVAEPAADATSYEDAGAPRGELNYRIRAIDSAGPDTSAVTLVDSLFYNEAVRVYARAYIIENWGTDPTESDGVSGLWTSEAFDTADTTPPDTTGVLAAPAIAWGDTTNTNAHIIATVDASASDEPLMAFSQVKVSHDGTWAPADTTGNWRPATATSSSFTDTVYSGETMAAISADTLYWRTMLRDMVSPPNYSAYIDITTPIATVLSRASAGGGTPTTWVLHNASAADSSSFDYSITGIYEYEGMYNYSPDTPNTVSQFDSGMAVTGSTIEGLGSTATYSERNRYGFLRFNLQHASFSGATIDSARLYLTTGDAQADFSQENEYFAVVAVTNDTVQEMVNGTSNDASVSYKTGTTPYSADMSVYTQPSDYGVVVKLYTDFTAIGSFGQFSVDVTSGVQAIINQGDTGLFGFIGYTPGGYASNTIQSFNAATVARRPILKVYGTVP